MGSILRLRSRPALTPGAPVRLLERERGFLIAPGQTTYLTAYDPATHPGAFPVATDWSAYATSAALHAAVSFGKGSPGQADPPKEYMVYKVNTDPVFPNRVIRYNFPYNNGCSVCTGSAGRAPAHTFTCTSSSFWVRFTRRFYGTAHPGGGATSNWTAAGTYPALAANSYKIAFINWSGGNGRMDDEISNTTAQIPGWDFGSLAPSQVDVAEPGLSQWYNTSVAPQLTGAEWYEFIFHYLRDSNTVAHTRAWMRQLTVAGSWNPQTYQYQGQRRDLATGSFPSVSNFALGVNKNKTNADDGLSAVTWDNPDQFSTDSSAPGTGRGVVGDPSYKGMRVDYGPVTPVDGTIESDPFGVDSHGRADPDW